MLKYLLVLLFPISVFAQDTHRSGYFETSLGYNQVKDALNYGFVYNGPLIPFQYGHQKNWQGHQRNLKLGFSMAYYAVEGMNGGAVYIQPLEYERLFPIKSSGIELSIGPMFQSQYEYNLYPEMQSGHMLWMTNYTLGFTLMGATEWKDHRIEFSWRNSLLNLTSRPDSEIDPYYYTTSFFDWIQIGNEDLQFGSLESFNTTRWRIEYFVNGSKRKHSFFYQGDYLVYRDDPSYKRFTNALGYRLFFKKSP